VQRCGESVGETATVVRRASQPDVRHSSSSSSSFSPASAARRSVTFNGFDNVHRLAGNHVGSTRLHGLNSKSVTTPVTPR